MSKVHFKIQGVPFMNEAEVNINEKVLYYNGTSSNVSQLPWDVPPLGTIYGTLLNYKGSIQRMESEFNKHPYYEAPKAPILYIKPINTLTSYGMPIPLPRDEKELEMGAALGIVMGRIASRVSQTEALDYVEGYTIVNDVSIPHESVYRPAVMQKARDGFCPVGPWIVQKEGIDPDSLGIRVFINNILKQKNTTANLVRSIPSLIADITEFMTLNQGDVLLAGIPENPPLAKAGDHVKIEIDHIGYLENRVVREDELVAGVRF